MTKKTEKHITRLELAEALESFARDVRNGLVSTDSGEWQVPDRIHTKLRLKEKKAVLKPNSVGDGRRSRIIPPRHGRTSIAGRAL